MNGSSFWWFSGASVEELTRQLTAHPGARFEVHPTNDGRCLLFVKPQGTVSPDGGGGGINDSHLCPPDCG